MKKNYLFLATMLTSMLSFAQGSVDGVKVGKHQDVSTAKVVTNVDRFKGGGPIWSNDFGTPSEWSFVANGTLAGLDDNWVIGTGVPDGDFPIAGIASTTASNGFAMFDSDFYCATSGTQNSDVRFIAPIDLTGFPAVQLTFESWYRKFQGTCWVIASTDGVTWTEFEIYGGLAVNASLPTNPTVTSVNISSVVGNSATAYIGFRYKGVCDYAWMVDDAAIEVLPDNDMAVGKVWAGDIVLDWDYSMVPVAQTKPMVVGVEISNAGAVAQTDIDAVLKISLGGTEVYTQTVTQNYPVAITDTLWITTTYTPTTVGTYTVEVSVPEDDIVGNESGSATIMTTNHVYGHDYLGTSVFRFNEDPESAMGNLYVMETTAEMRGFQVEFETGTTPNQEVIARLYLVGDNIQDLTFIDEVYYTVTAAQIGPNKTTNILLNAPLTLDAGSAYVIEVRKQAGASRIFFGGSDLGDDDNSTVCFGPFGAADAVNWYTGWGFSPAVRANFDPSLSVSTLVDLKGVNVFPNPSEGIVNISNDLNTENTITVLDITGKVVFTKVASSATTVDLSKVGTGVYMVEVSNETGKSVERVVIR